MGGKSVEEESAYFWQTTFLITRESFKKNIFLILMLCVGGGNHNFYNLSIIENLEI